MNGSEETVDSRSPRHTGETAGGFIDRFDPAVARVLRASRAVLRKRLPTAFQLIYDNYNFLVIGFCATERPSDCIVSLAAAANGVGLSLYDGAGLPDREGFLLGSGNQNRLSGRECKDPVKPRHRGAHRCRRREEQTPPRPTGKGETIVRSISARQRPRRTPAKSSSRTRRAR